MVEAETTTQRRKEAEGFIRNPNPGRLDSHVYLDGLRKIRDLDR